MKHVKVKSETYRDNSVKSINLPTLLIEYDGEVQVLEQLHQYQLEHKSKSRSWHNKLVQTVGLLLDYMQANQDNYTSAKDFFEIFTESIYEGTINEDGFDPSGLYWIPKRTETANMLLTTLNGFSDWMHDEYGAAQLYPWREASSYEQRLNWMAQINKSHHSFLGHLNDVHAMTETAKQIRNVKNRRKPYYAHGGTKAFPEDQIHNFLWKGFMKARKNMDLNRIDRYNWRDIAITILMHGGGLRHSKVFHLWVQDVFPDPEDPDLAVVRLYHPSEGKAPEDSKAQQMGNMQPIERLTYCSNMVYYLATAIQTLISGLQVGKNQDSTMTKINTCMFIGSQRNGATFLCTFGKCIWHKCFVRAFQYSPLCFCESSPKIPRRNDAFKNAKTITCKGR